MIVNKIRVEGNSIFIKSNPITGLLALTSFTDNSSGESEGRSFTKTFRYSKNGVIFSDWYPLTVSNITTLDVNSKDILVIELQYKKNPVGEPLLTVSSATIDTTDSIQIESEIFKNSMFYQFFGSNSIEVLNWMINVLDKLFQKGLLPNYIDRYNDDGSPDDFLEFWGSVCKFFAFYVVYARKYQKFYESEILLAEFLEQRGLKTTPENTLEQLQELMEKYNREVSKRGTKHIVDKTTEGISFDGEFLRLINYDYTIDEFVFNVNKSEHFGWTLDKSSPLYRGLTIHDNANKFYEQSEQPVDISIYPVIGTVTIAEDETIGKDVFNISANSGIGQLVGNPTDFAIPVDEFMDYEFSFFIKKGDGDDLTVGFNALDQDQESINLLSRSTGLTLNNFLVNKNILRSDKYVYCRFFLYNKLKPVYSYDGVNLKMVDNVHYIIPKITIGAGGSAKVYNVRLVPMALPYSKGFIQVNNFIDSILKNRNNQFDIFDLTRYVKKYLIPYSSHIKISEINQVGDFSQDVYVAPDTFPVLPTVTTSDPEDEESTSARLGGNVTNDGGSPVNEHGIVWGLTSDPTIDDNRVPIGIGSGEFDKIVTGLTSGATIYVRAYAINSVGISYGNEVSLDTVMTVLSINRADSTPTNSNTVEFEVVFSGSVTGVTAANFALAISGLTGASIDSISGSGSTYTVIVNTGTGSGTVGLNMVNDTDLSNEIGNLTFTGQVYLIDKIAPTATITSSPSELTNSTTASFSFSGVDTGGSGLAGFLVSIDGGAFESATSPKVYTGISSGLHSFEVKAVDNAGNIGEPDSFNWEIDTVAPTVVSSNRHIPTDVDIEGLTEVTFRVTFSKPVTGVTASDFELSLTGTAAGTVASVTPVSTSVYDVLVNSVTGIGLLKLILKSTGTGIVDLAGNPISGGYTGGQSYNLISTVGSVSVTSSLAGISVTNITGITGFVLENPVSAGGSETGTHEGFTLSDIIITLDGSPVINGNCSLSVGGVVIACTNIPTSPLVPVVEFNNVTADVSDAIIVAMNTGSCP